MDYIKINNFVDIGIFGSVERQAAGRSEQAVAVWIGPETGDRP